MCVYLKVFGAYCIRISNYVLLSPFHFLDILVIGSHINRKTIAVNNNENSEQGFVFLAGWPSERACDSNWQCPIWLSHTHTYPSLRSKQLNKRWMTATRHGKLLFNQAFRGPHGLFTQFSLIFTVVIPSLQFSHLLDSTIQCNTIRT